MVLITAIAGLVCALLFCFQERLDRCSPQPLGLPPRVLEQRRKTAARRFLQFRMLNSVTRLIWSVLVSSYHGPFVCGAAFFYSIIRPGFQVSLWVHRVLLLVIVVSSIYQDVFDLSAEHRQLAAFNIATRGMAGLIMTESCTEYLAEMIIVVAVCVDQQHTGMDQYLKAGSLLAFFVLLWWTHKQNTDEFRDPHRYLMVTATILFLSFVLPYIPADSLPKVGLAGASASAALLVFLEFFDVSWVGSKITRQHPQRVLELNIQWHLAARHTSLLLNALLAVALLSSLLTRKLTPAAVLGLVLVGLIKVKPTYHRLRLLLHGALLARTLVQVAFEFGILASLPPQCCGPMASCIIHVVLSLPLQRSVDEHMAELVYVVSVACSSRSSHNTFVVSALLLVLLVNMASQHLVWRENNYFPMAHCVTKRHSEASQIMSHHHKPRPAHKGSESSNCECDMSCTCH